MHLIMARLKYSTHSHVLTPWQHREKNRNERPWCCVVLCNPSLVRCKPSVHLPHTPYTNYFMLTPHPLSILPAPHPIIHASPSLSYSLPYPLHPPLSSSTLHLHLITSLAPPSPPPSPPSLQSRFIFYSPISLLSTPISLELPFAWQNKHSWETDSVLPLVKRMCSEKSHVVVMDVVGICSWQYYNEYSLSCRKYINSYLTNATFDARFPHISTFTSCIM